MSAVILPNGSLVFRLPQWTVHVDEDARQIHLRDGSTRDELGGVVFATAPVDTVRRVFLLPDNTTHAHLALEFITGETLDLGRIPMGVMGKRIAYALARIARCGITSHLDVTHHGQTREEPPFHEQDTRILSMGSDGTRVRREGEIDTVPRLGWRDEWREDFIGVGSPTPVAATTIDGPELPLRTVSVELVDPSEASTKRPRGGEEEHEEPTLRIDLLMRAAS